MTSLRRLRLEIPPSPHDYLLGRAVLDVAGAEIATVLDPGPCLLVTDERLAAELPAHALEASLSAAGFAPAVLALPVGEEGKSVAQAERVWNALASHGVERSGGVIAFGGGSVGDLAGFCAATWMRGVALVQVPTTLLAMADSAVGGKAAVNLADGKNLVGAVHPARLVLADIDLLGGLPDREVASGLAEVVKCAVLDGVEALVRLRERAEALRARDPDALADAVEHAVRVKAAHVRDDLHDLGGARALLNLGHTTAHAIEAEAGYGAVRHGEAVAIGLVVAARLAGHGELRTSIEELLHVFDLPTTVPPDLAPERLVTRARQDKKRRGGRHVMVLPGASGGAQVAEVSDADFLAALRA